MAYPVIKAENLGKSYIIGHEHRESYTALRDVIALKTKQIVMKTRHMFNGGQLISGNEFEEFWALKNISFEINQGDSVGVIGRNGAGKSTLLKILSRITEPTTGRISIKGRVASLLEVGTGFHPELTGRENIFLNGAILGMSRKEIRSKFDEIVDFSGIEKFLDTPVKRYSSGMYVRLAFSVAAHLETEILVVDEVLAVGDAEFQKKCLNKMDSVSKGEGRTVLFVSHNLSSIKQLCTKGFLLNKGTIIYAGTPQMTIDNYLSGYQNIGIINKYVKPALEGKDIELIHAEVLDNNGNLKEQFEISEEIFFSLTLKCTRLVPNVYGYVAIANTLGELLIESDTFDRLPNVLEKMVIGENQFLIRLNSNILAYGEYIFYISFASTFSDNFMVDIPGEILRFNIIDSETKRGQTRTSKTSYLFKWELQNAI
jgi:lipopolysaccharide transport system ATP-binding protein